MAQLRDPAFALLTIPPLTQVVAQTLDLDAHLFAATIVRRVLRPAWRFRTTAAGCSSTARAALSTASRTALSTTARAALPTAARPAVADGACGTARVRPTITARRTGVVRACAVRRVSCLRMRTQLVAQLRDLVPQRFDQLFDFGSIRHVCLVTRAGTN